jgi:hypothetical protein
MPLIRRECWNDLIGDFPVIQDEVISCYYYSFLFYKEKKNMLNSISLIRLR